MFGKLLKYEFLATWRQFGMVAGVLFLVSCTLLVPVVFNVPVLGQLGLILAFIGFVAMGGVIPLLLAIHYWRTMYGGPGYLTHSLPVRGRAIFAAKATYMCVVSVVAIAVAVVAAFGLPYLATRRNALGAFFDDVFPPIRQLLHTGQLWILLIIIPVYMCGLCVQYLSGMTLGTRGRLSSLGAGGAVLGLIGVYLVSQVVSAVSLLTVPWSMRVSGPAAGTLTGQAMGLGVFAGGDPGFVGLGWAPVALVLAAVLAVLAIRSIEHHTCLR